MKKLVLMFSVFIFTGNLNAQITNGLVAFYPFDGNAKDASGNHHNGTVYNATLTKDRFGISKSAYNFNGTDTRIEIGDHPDFHIANLTISAWLNLNTELTSAPFQSWVSKSIGINTFNSYVAYYDNGGKNIGGYFSDGNSDQNITAPYTISGQWFYYTFTYEDASKTTKLYLNGNLVNTSTATISLGYDNSPVTIGCEYQNNELMFFVNGKIDDVRIYNRVLSSSEVASLYTDGCIKPKGLKATDITSTDARLKWKTVPNAVAYRINRRKKGKSDYTIVDVTDTSKVIKNLKDNTTYEWNVQSICSYSPLILSDTAKGNDFTTTASFINDFNGSESLKINDRFTASLSPNPVKSTAILSVSGNKTVSVIITDISGKVLLKKNTAERKIMLPTQNLFNGTYLVSVTDGEQKKTLKLVKAD